MNAYGIGSLARYSSFQQVGEGTYGYVYRAVDLKTNEAVALKKLIIHKETSGFPMCFVREIKFLKALKHKNIVQLRDIVTSKGCEQLESEMKTSTNNSKQNLAQILAQGPGKVPNPLLPSNAVDAGKAQENAADSAKAAQQEACRLQLQRCGSLYLVFEYMDHDLGGLIDSKYHFSLAAIKSIAKQLFEVLDYLSEKKVLHRDIKSSNILISNYHHVKLADFGLARTTTGADGREGMHDLTNNVITMWYKPPELLLGAQRYSFSIDMWSVGCVIAELELGHPIFPGKSEVEQLDIIFRTIGTPTEETWPNLPSLPLYETRCKQEIPKYYNVNLRTSYLGVTMSDAVIELLDRILVADPSKRITPNIALTHKFFLLDPVPPENPASLGLLSIPQGASFHEYETKRIRKAKEEELRKLQKAASADMKQQPAAVKETVTAPPKLAVNPPPPAPKPDNNPYVAACQPAVGQGSKSSYTETQDSQHSLLTASMDHPKPSDYDSSLSYYNTQSLYPMFDQPFGDQRLYQDGTTSTGAVVKEQSSMMHARPNQPQLIYTNSTPIDEAYSQRPPQPPQLVALPSKSFSVTQPYHQSSSSKQSNLLHAVDNRSEGSQSSSTYADSSRRFGNQETWRKRPYPS
jgi:cyclin-dependent kinase 12/13